MDEKQVISQKIIEDANLQAEQIVQNALNRADEARANANKQAQELVETARAEGQQNCDLIVERKKTIARLDAKKVVLSAKQELVESAFEVALKKLNALEKSDYLNFIEKQLKAYAEQGDRVIICKSAPVSVQEVLSLAVSTELSLSAVIGEDFGGGIKLQGGKCDKDLSFKATVLEYANNNAQEISAIIFK